MAKHARQQEAAWEDAYRYHRAADERGYGSSGAAYEGRDWGYPATPASAESYSRDAYAEWWATEGKKARGHRRGGFSGARHGGGVARKVLAAVAALVLVLAAVLAWYGHEFDSRVAANQSTPNEMAEVLTPATLGQPYYILLLGSDWRENSGTSRYEEMSGDQQRADVIILARMDAANNQVTLVTVPRDTRWEHDGAVNKINEAYNIGGAALQTQVVSELCGVPIAHTVEIHFSGLEGLVDALGGITVTVPQTIKAKDALTGEYITVEEGTQLLDGQAVQILARVRKAYTDQEGARQSNVRMIVNAVVDTIREKPLYEIPGLGLKIAECFGTDMRFLDFAGLALSFGKGGLTMYSGTGPNQGDIDDAAGGLWLCYVNPDGWQRVMDVVEAGGDPSTVDPNEGYAEQGMADWEADAEEYVGGDFGYSY